MQNSPNNRSETLGEVVFNAIVDDHARSHLVGVDPMAVDFHLVHPAVASGHFLGADIGLQAG
jgi:hypothetical protein